MALSRESWFLVLTTALLGCCYAMGLPSTLTECDAGEFVALALRGGVAHPPGYPLYTMVLRLVALIAPSSALVPVLAATSAVFALAGAALLFRALRVVVPQPEWRAAAVVVGGTAEPAWRAATGIEPFGLHLLLVGAALAASAACLASASTARPPALLGLTFGLGFAHHHMLVLLAPLGAMALLGGASTWSTRARATLAFGGGFVVGCLPILYLVVVDKSGPYVWGDWSAFGAGLVKHLRREQFGSTSLFIGASGPWWSAPVHFLSTSLSHLSFVWFAVALAGAAALARGGRARAGGLALTTIAVVWFLSRCRLDVPVEGLPRVVVERFFSMPDLLLAFPIAAALAAVGERSRVARPAVALLVLGHVALQAPTSMRGGERVYEAYLDDVARAVRPREVLLTGSDADFMGALYLKARGLDIDIVQLPMMVLSSYRRSVRASLWPEAPLAFSNADLVQHLLESGRPVSMASTPTAAAALLERSYPFGPLVRLVPPGEEPPTLDVVVARNAAFADRSTMLARARAQATIEPWAAVALSNTRRTWQSLVDVLAAAPAGVALTDARRRLAELDALEARLRF